MEEKEEGKEKGKEADEVEWMRGAYKRVKNPSWNKTEWDSEAEVVLILKREVDEWNEDCG